MSLRHKRNKILSGYLKLVYLELLKHPVLEAHQCSMKKCNLQSLQQNLKQAKVTQSHKIIYIIMHPHNFISVVKFCGAKATMEFEQFSNSRRDLYKICIKVAIKNLGTKYQRP